MPERSEELADLTRRGFLTAAGTAFVVATTNAFAAPPLAPPDKQPAELKLPQPVKKKAGWAVVGLGQLAVEEVLPAFALCAQSELVALVSGHPDKARQLAEHYGVDPKRIYSYETYDKLADDGAVDIVYNILPNSMHAEYTMRAHKAGKHVLCEKPMAVTSEECRRMIGAAKQADRKLMVAYRLRYEPYNQAVIEMVQKKTFGPVRLIDTANVQNTNAPNIRLSKALGGGPVGDVGIYCLNACRYILNEEPVQVSAFAHQPKDDPRFTEVPASVIFSLRFPSGVLANCACSFNTSTSRRLRVYCEKGYIDLDPAFSYTGLSLKTSDGKSQTEHDLPEVNHFAAEMDHFSDCVLNNQPPRTPGEEGLRDMVITEAIDESYRTGKPVTV